MSMRRYAFLIALAVETTATSARAQGGAAALFASGDAALAVRNFDRAWHDCNLAATLLANGPPERLGRAQFCAAQAARALGQNATAVELATRAIQNIETSRTTIARYQGDLRRARNLVQELGPHLPARPEEHVPTRQGVSPMVEASTGPTQSVAPQPSSTILEFGFEAGYLGFLEYRPLVDSTAADVLTSEHSPAIGAALTFDRRIVSDLFLEIQLRGGLRTAYGAGWYAVGGFGLALLPDGWIGTSLCALVGGAIYDQVFDHHRGSAILNDVRVVPAQGGASIGGEVALRLALASWSRVALTLTFRVTVLKDVSEPGAVLLAPATLGVRWR